MSDYNIFSFVKLAFSLICFSVVLYLTTKEILRYTNNEDTSSIAFKKFNASPRDKYPIISFCFYGKYSSIYKKDKLEASGMSIAQYWNIITGRSEVNVSEIISLPEFPLVTIKLKELTKKFNTENEKGEYINRWSVNETWKPPSENNSLLPLLESSYWPFHVSYQNPDQICFTQKNKFKKGMIKLLDYLQLDDVMLNDLPDIGFLYIYIHYPGHTVRSFGKEVYSIKLSQQYVKKRLMIRISSVTVLRRRTDAKTPCNSTLENEDSEYQKRIIRTVGCIPPYLVSSDTETTGYERCKTSSKLSEAYNLSQFGNVKSSLEQYDPPCEEITVSTSVDLQYGNDLNMNFQYRTDQYLEIKNKRDFGVTNLWSSIGGFVGIFLGYSLLQLPEILISRISWLVTEKNAKSKLTN